jgi:putative membrane protein
MVKFIIRWLINSVALFAAIRVVEAVTGGVFPDNIGWQTYVWGGLILGLINALLRPLLTVLTCPLILLTLGLFTFVINTFLFWLVGVVGSWFGVGYSLGSFWDALLGAIVISAVSFVLSMVLKDELKGRHTSQRPG